MVDDLELRQPASDGPGSEGWWSSLLTHIEGDIRAAGEQENINDRGTTHETIDWGRVEHDMYNERIFTCEVVGYNHGGLLVTHSELRGFVPLSHLLSGHTSSQTRRVKELVGSSLRLRVIECDPERDRVVLSERAAQTERGERDQLLSRIFKDQRVQGVVTHVTKFGVFVDIGGVEGLVHISELSWARVSHPRKRAKEGDEIEALVINVDKSRGRVGLSLKRLQPNPWESVEQRYQIGQNYSAEVTELMRYGAFARLEAGIEGLLHNSKIGLRGTQRPWDVLERGQWINVCILDIDVEKQRISLGLTADGLKPSGEIG